jgi:hypothetical protein
MHPCLRSAKTERRQCMRWKLLDAGPPTTYARPTGLALIEPERS